MEKLNASIGRISPSLTIALTAKAKEMKSKGIDVVNFAAGEPDFDTPDNIKQAAIRAIEDGLTKYTPAGGMNELRDAVVEKEKKVNGLEYSRENVCISVGAKHALFNIMMIMLSPGDEVIIPSPYWISYEAIVRFVGAKPVILPTKEENGFVLDAEILGRGVTERTKLLILNNPSNPTGGIYSRKELEVIAELACKHNFWIVSDEIYEEIVFDGYRPVSIAALSDDVKARTLVVNGVSKTYSMTGWRIGYTCGDADVVEGMIKLQSQSTTNPTTIAQAAAIEALTGDQSSVEVMRKTFEERRNYIVEQLNAIDGISCFKPGGSFYVFPNVSGVFGRRHGNVTVNGSMDFAMQLLESENVVVVPGVAFGDDRFVRISFATDMDSIKRGIEGIKRFVEKLQ